MDRIIKILQEELEVWLDKKALHESRNKVEVGVHWWSEENDYILNEIDNLQKAIDILKGV